MSSTLIGFLWAVVSALCLGVGTFLYKISTRSLSPSDTTFYYYWCSALLATVVWLLSADRVAPIERGHLVWPALMAVFLCASVWTFSSAVQTIDISVASTIRGLSFIPAAVLGLIVYGERLTPKAILAILLMAGAVFLLGSDLVEQGEKG